MTDSFQPETANREIEVPAGDQYLRGILGIPAEPEGIVLFAHGSGSSRHSPRNQFVAEQLQIGGFVTLLLDLLTEDEAGNRQRVFDVELLANRLLAATVWVREEPDLRGLPVGYFGASTGAAAAIVAATRAGDAVRAIVSRGGRPDLAGSALGRLSAPILLIVGSLDDEVLRLNTSAMSHIHANCELATVPGATHLFEQDDALKQVAELALQWFKQYFPPPPTP